MYYPTPHSVYLLIIFPRAEKLRGNWMTQYGGSSLENVDLGHANAVQWIDKNIMQPTEALAKTWKVSL
jgi:hypothetical protein